MTSLSNRSQRPGPSETRTPNPLTDSVKAPDVSGPDPEYAERKRQDEEIPGLRDRPQSIPSSSSLAVGAGENEDLVISSIRATDVDLRLGRIPAGFYTAVQHSGRTWRTDVKPVLVDNNDVEWNGLIPIPSDVSATVCLGIFATFEFQPILGDGEQLQRLTITVEELLDRSAQGLPFVFFQEDEDVLSPCRSLLVTVRRQRHEDSDSLMSRVLGPHCLITEARSELEEATDQGHRALSQYRDYGEIQDLENSIEHFTRALEICPLDHPGRAAVQSNMAEAAFMHGLLDNSDIPLDVPLVLYRNALAARPAGHLDRPFTLIQSAAVHFARFEQRRDEADALQADALLREAMDLSSVESHENQTAATMLRLYATRGTVPVQETGQLSVEQDPASGLVDVDSWSLGVQLLQRFRRSTDLADLQQAISVLGELLRSISVRDDQYLPALANLGVALWGRFDHLGDLGDLEKAISTLGGVVDLTSDGDPDKPIYLSNLGNSFKARFERLGEQSDLEQAISKFKGALDLTPDNHPDKCTRLSHLGSSFRVRFERFSDLNDLEQAISTQKDAVDLAPHGHPDRCICLNNLGTSFLTRFNYLGELSDLEQAILRFRDADDLTLDGHPDKSSGLHNLGESYFARFQRLGEQGDLEQAISRQSDAVHLTPDAHPNKPTYLGHLGTSLLTRFTHLGGLNDLEQAISNHGDAVNLTPDGHPDRSTRLYSLGHSLLVRFEHLGGPSYLEQAIARFRDAVDTTPDGHSTKPSHLNSLGDSFLARYTHLGDLSDLEQAISKQSSAIALIPDGHSDKPIYLNNLGNSFLTRFERLGELSDLEQTISMYRNAIDLTPDGHPGKPACLNNLGSSLSSRFQRLGELMDLEHAISKFRDAIDLTLRLDDQPNQPAYLNNLSTSLLTRFERLGELTDLEQAISSSRDAVDLIPNSHPYKPTCLNNFGLSLFARFECFGERSDLEQAVSRFGDAVDLTPGDHVDKPHRLDNLGKSLFARFKLSGELGDFEQAISKLGVAVDLTPDCHPDKPSYLVHFGDPFRLRFERLGASSDLEQAISLYSRAACAPIGPIADRFRASQLWISCARTLRHHSLLHAYSIAVGLLPQLAWIGLSLANRYRELLQGADVVREAAAAALDSGRPETAVEWLEQGRSIIWGELFQLRSSYDELSSAYPDHARRLRELSAALEYASATREKSLSSLSPEERRDAERRGTASLEQEVDRHRTLAIERDKLLEEIRGLPGFERFLLHKEFPQLRAAARSGPVVMLNAAEGRCDALIILADAKNAFHVPLPGYTLERSKSLQSKIKSLLGPVRAIPHNDRHGQPVLQEIVNEWASILGPLWKCVVKPVLDALGFSIPGDLSRIFWCPTGPFTFLPIHAAGFYGTHHLQPGHKVFDFVVSSYVPTLSILVPSPSSDVAPSDELCLLAVRQPPSDGLFRLPGVDVELEHIRSVIKDSPSARTTFIESSTGTVEEVLSLMKNANWVHFACHGIQDSTNPTRSGLCLADRRRLQLSDIIALSRPHGGLAFLSACQTAKGDEDLSDEAIHIAAGMLFAGYGGVVGTMWSISDRLAPRVAKDVYEQLLQGEEWPDYRRAARALQDAVGRLRGSSDVSFVDWLPFIHVGL